jgi:hypothetical protein
MLKKQEEEVSRLNGELVQISISHEDQRQSLERPHTSSCRVRLRRRASPSRWRRSRLKVSLFSSGSCLLICSLVC